MEKRGGISNRVAYANGVWDWRFEVVEHCFGNTKISPTDIDGIGVVGLTHIETVRAVVERKGYFLIQETKSPWAAEQDGQRFLFDALLRLNVELGRPAFTIFTIWGTQEQPRANEVVYPKVDKIVVRANGRTHEYDGHGYHAVLVRLVKNWWDMADSQSFQRTNAAVANASVIQ